MQKDGTREAGTRQDEKENATYFNEKTAPDATHQDRCTHRDRSTMRQREPQTITPLER